MASRLNGGCPARWSDRRSLPGAGGGQIRRLRDSQTRLSHTRHAAGLVFRSWPSAQTHSGHSPRRGSGRRAWVETSGWGSRLCSARQRLRAANSVVVPLAMVVASARKQRSTPRIEKPTRSPGPMRPRGRLPGEEDGIRRQTALGRQRWPQPNPGKSDRMPVRCGPRPTSGQGAAGPAPEGDWR